MKDFGESLVGLGIMGCIFFWFIYDPTVSIPSNPHFNGRVVNIHRSQTQTRGIMISIGAAVVGAILVASGKPSESDDGEHSSESAPAKNEASSVISKQQPDASQPTTSTHPSPTPPRQQQTRTEGAVVSRITKPPPPPPRRKT